MSSTRRNTSFCGYICESRLLPANKYRVVETKCRASAKEINAFKTNICSAFLKRTTSCRNRQLHGFPQTNKESKPTIAELLAKKHRFVETDNQTNKELSKPTIAGIPKDLVPIGRGSWECGLPNMKVAFPNQNKLHEAPPNKHHRWPVGKIDALENGVNPI